MLLLGFTAYGQRQFELPLYPEGAPDSNEITEPLHDYGGHRIANITVPTIEVWLPEASKCTGRAVVICPGGGYSYVSLDNEGYAPAQWLNDNGIAAVILKYRLPNKHHQIPLEDVQKALTTAREKAAEWNIDAAKVGVMGFSAGGHLAASASTLFTCEAERPAFSVLIYPVITLTERYTHWGTRTCLVGDGRQAELVARYSLENNVTENTPPVFLALCSDDTVVAPQNSTMFYDALVARGHRPEMHIYPRGGHGWGFSSTKFVNMADVKAALRSWLDRLP